jgi:small subunit ribosomal protein S11
MGHVFFLANNKRFQIKIKNKTKRQKEMTFKEIHSLNLHNFLPTKTPRLPVQTTFVASKVHSKDSHPLITCATFAPYLALRSHSTALGYTYCFARKATNCFTCKAISVPLGLQSTKNDLFEKKNSVLLNACATQPKVVLLGTKTHATSAVEPTTSKKLVEGRKQQEKVLDNVKTKHALKPSPFCWVENRNKNGKPFNSNLDKQWSAVRAKKQEKRNKQFQKNSSNKLLTSRTQIKTPRNIDKAKTGVIYLYYTSNNTVCTLVDFKGVTKGWSSCGSLGFKSARKSTAYASQATTEKIGLKAKEYGFKWAFLVLKGVGRGKESGVRALRKSGIEILGVLEKTGIPHNGCRAPRKRRI